MSMSGDEAYVLAMDYVDETLEGGGALKGDDGKSAYQSWLDLGNTGTEEDFINSLKGEKGQVGEKGETGNNGKSSYEIWLDNGNVGTEQDFLDSLKGYGADGFSPVITENSNNTDEDYRLDIETKESKFTTPNLKADISKNIAEHNTSPDSHNDIRIFLNELNNRLNALANSDDETLDEMKEVVAYIKDNRSLIESITTTKVNVADIIDNLTTNVSNKPLSASQGVVIKNLIDTLQSELTAHINNFDIHVTASDKTNWNNATDKINDLKIADVNGLQTIADNNQFCKGLFATKGWYRIAEFNGNVGSIVGASANACEIILKRIYQSTSNSEVHKLLLKSRYNNQNFASIYSVSDKDFQLYKKIRYVYDSSTLKAYIDVYYNSEQSNRTAIILNNGKDSESYWKVIESPIIVQETTEGETVSTVFDIPANATPVTDLDLTIEGIQGLRAELDELRSLITNS